MSSEVAIQLEHEATKRMYERLVAAHDKFLDFDETIKRDLEGSRTFQEAFCCTDPVYKEQMEIIKTSKPDIITSDTVGAYLHSCFQPESTVETACTPACINGLKNSDLMSCDAVVYEKKNGKLQKLNTFTGDYADVFIATGDTITSDDKAILKWDNINIITLYNQNGTTINYILAESINLEHSDKSEQSGPSQQLDQAQSTTLNNWTLAWVLILIALIILVIIIIIIITQQPWMFS